MPHDLVLFVESENIDLIKVESTMMFPKTRESRGGRLMSTKLQLNMRKSCALLHNRVTIDNNDLVCVLVNFLSF